MSSCQPKWELVWEDNFDAVGILDDDVWSKIPRNHTGWGHYMSDSDYLYDVRDGNLILRGIVNPDVSGDPVPYLTGGVYTKHKKGFYLGKLEIRAKLGEAQGAWPAFWLLPSDGTFNKTLHGTEIDIMEHLNSDSVVYQTVHSYYTIHLNQKEPRQNVIAPINRGEYNTYGVELYADSLVFSVNGRRTHTYPRIETDLEGQFPFDVSHYLLLDMQIGGTDWVGEVVPADFPVEMFIDWVRFYEWK
jgi:beta-glucanase (GH16 family)